jgi:hypothetical protein
LLEQYTRDIADRMANPTTLDYDYAIANDLANYLD